MLAFSSSWKEVVNRKQNDGGEVRENLCMYLGSGMFSECQSMQ